MNIHEYQAKALLRSYGAPVSDGRVVLKAEDAKTAAGEMDGPLWVVKAQIHAGGRGKGTIIGNESQHGVQLVLPVLAEYCPGRHGRHAAPVASAYLPLSQATQRSAVHVVAFDALRSESKL